MTDEQLKRLVKEGMEWEAEQLMKIINSDPTLKDVKCPEEVHDRLFEQIRLYEEQKAQEARDQLSHEDKELLRLGTICRRRRKWNRYVVLAAALVAVLAVGIVSMGHGENIFSVITKMFAGREQTVVDSGETEPNTFLAEEEIYEKIETTYGFSPIKLEYLPAGTSFQEGIIGEQIQEIKLIYGTKDTADVTYIIWPNYRDTSCATDIEDKKIQEYQMEVNGVTISIKEYLIEDSGENRWALHFEFQNVHYFLRITDLHQDEVEEILSNLRFIK